MFGVFTVRDGRIVAICEPRILEHTMGAPTSIGDGQTLLGFVKTNDGSRYKCLLDVESGEQRLLKFDSLGRPVESGSLDLTWVRDVGQIQRTKVPMYFLDELRALDGKPLLHCRPSELR